MKNKKIEAILKEFQKRFFIGHGDGYLYPINSPDTLAFMKSFLREKLEIKNKGGGE